MEEGFRH